MQYDVVTSAFCPYSYPPFFCLYSKFRQGLTYANNRLFESTGLYGESSLLILDPNTAAVVKQVPMDPSLFGEGLAYITGNLLQITWKARKGFVYNSDTLEVVRPFTFSTTRNEGWGITYDECRNEIIVTDGSNNLHFWDPATLTEIRKVSVMRQSAAPAANLNEIEFWRGRVIANVWYEDVILVINPVNGEVEKEYGTYVSSV